LKQAYDQNILGGVQGFVPENIQFECVMGSHAYGTQSDDSDQDIYGFTIPPKGRIFPHTKGLIPRFDDCPTFGQYQKHHIDMDGKEYDFQIYGIIKYFKLIMDNNPNMIDSLFVPQECITHMTEVGRILRRNRKKFLHKGSYHRYRGYAHSQLSDMDRDREGSRKEIVEKHGYDTKAAYHVVRLVLQAEEILTEGDLHLRRNKDILKNIRNGEWSHDRVEEYFHDKEKKLDELYETSDLRHEVNHSEIKGILMKCLRCFFGDLSDDIKTDDQYQRAVQEIKSIVRDL
jgi:predicted nucleotidyltransferase